MDKLYRCPSEGLRNDYRIYYELNFIFPSFETLCRQLSTQTTNSSDESIFYYWLRSSEFLWWCWRGEKSLYWRPFVSQRRTWWVTWLYLNRCKKFQIRSMCSHHILSLIYFTIMIKIYSKEFTYTWKKVMHRKTNCSVNVQNAMCANFIT